jgi:aspartyl/asparaginyl-tRNA synthetase
MIQKTLSSYYSVRTYHHTVTKLRSFFLNRGFLEVDSQSPQHILAACEDPSTVATYSMSTGSWPLPQTGQMWLEEVLLKNPDLPGVFCHTTSYRDEPTPDAARHLRIFPLFEFETHGDMQVLQNLMTDLFEYLGFGSQESFAEGDYNDIASRFGVRTVEAKEEIEIGKKFSHVFFLKNFPAYSHPFFNMKRANGLAKKIDVLCYGMETIGSAERSCSADEMWEDFHSISDGGYSKLLFDKFGKKRVIAELESYLSLNFIPRCGGGIGVHRLMRGMTLHQDAQLAQGWNIATVQPQNQL